MEARFEVRKQELLDECKIAPGVFQRILPRLTSFMEPFLQSFVRSKQCEHAETYLKGLLSDLERKNAESIAYRFGKERLGLQRFVGQAEWDDQPMRAELVRQVGQELGEEDGVIVFDPSGFPKSGTESVGTQRQWLGRLGKVDNGQVATFMGYVSSKEHALVDMRLYLPEEWARDKNRRAKAGVPKRIRFQTRHQHALEMLEQNGKLLPHSWVTGDDEMGRPYTFRRDLNELNEQYLLAVPSNMLLRDLDAPPPPYRGVGQPPKRPWQRVDKWVNAIPEGSWTEIDVRDGSKGPLRIEILKRRIAGRTDQRRQAPEEILVVIRFLRRDDKRVVQTDYYMSNASDHVPLEEFARVAKAEHRIEECLQRAKSEAGLADYEVRGWKGWHHHQTLSLIASWFLVCESRREKKDASDYGATDSQRDGAYHSSSHTMWQSRTNHMGARAATKTQRTRSLVSLETT